MYTNMKYETRQVEALLEIGDYSCPGLSCITILYLLGISRRKLDDGYSQIVAQQAQQRKDK